MVTTTSVAIPSTVDNMAMAPHSNSKALDRNRPGATGSLVREYVMPGEMRIIGERRNIEDLWKDDQWNSIRVRMEGDAPHMTVWRVLPATHGTVAGGRVRRIPATSVRCREPGGG